MFLVKIPAVDVGNHILQKFQVLVPKKVFPGIHVHTWLYFKWKKHMSTQEQEELDGIRRSPYHHWCSKTLPQSPPSIGNRFRERLQFLYNTITSRFCLIVPRGFALVCSSQDRGWQFQETHAHFKMAYAASLATSELASAAMLASTSWHFDDKNSSAGSECS